ncbi:MAG: MarR family transcriptional regulator [Marinibacterium sp.]|nr:MarR family transcriptional regulator [Marinibacterium sp.]
MRDAQINLTPVQFSALHVLEDQPGVDQATVASAIGYDRATLGKVIDRLVDRALVERSVSKRDRRARELYLTSQGRDVLQTALPLVREIQNRLLADISPSDAASFKATLRHLLQSSGTDGLGPENA